jgi:butyryl-CoA dehydrogenase
MAEKFASKRNINFMLYEVFTVEELTGYEFFQDHSRETFDLAVDTVWKLAADVMYPTFREMDQNPPQYLDGQAKVSPAAREYLRICGEGGWINPIWSYEEGGQQLPYTVDIVKQVIMAAAN